MATKDIRSFIKAAKAKAGSADKENSGIQIFSSSRAIIRPSFPYSGEVVEILAEDHSFVIPKEVACVVGSWRRMFSSGITYKEVESRQFRVNFSAASVETLIRFCFAEVLNNPRFVMKLIDQVNHSKTGTSFEADGVQVNEHGYAVPLKERVVFQFPIEPDQVMEVLMAAHFLDVPTLVDLTSYMLSHHIEDVPSLEGFPDEVVRQIYSRLSLEALSRLESAPFDLEEFWITAFQRAGWVLPEDTSNVDWKKYYVEGELDKKITVLVNQDRAAFEQQELYQQLLEFLDQNGHLIKRCRLLRFTKFPSMYSRLLQLPNLTSVNMSNTTHSADQYVLIGSELSQRPNVINLNMSQCLVSGEHEQRTISAQLDASVLVAMKLQHIEELDFTSNAFGEPTTELAVQQCMLTMPHLRVLRLSRNLPVKASTVAGIFYAARTLPLHTLNFELCRHLCLEQIPATAWEALRECKTLRTLHFGVCRYQAQKGVFNLAAVLPTCVTDLRLHEMNLPVKLCVQQLQQLQPQLVSLDVSHNQCAVSDFTPVLVSLVTGRGALQCVNLSGFPVTASAFKALCDALKHTQLRELVLREGMLTPVQLQQLQECSEGKCVVISNQDAPHRRLVHVSARE